MKGKPQVSGRCSRFRTWVRPRVAPRGRLRAGAATTPTCNPPPAARSGAEFGAGCTSVWSIRTSAGGGGAAYGLRDRRLPRDEAPLVADRAVVVEHRGQHSGHVGARYGAPRHVPQRHPTRPLVVGEPAGPDDRPVEVGLTQGGIGVPLRLDVRPPHLTGVVRDRIVDADRRDLHEPSDPRLASSLDRLQGALEVDGALALDVAVRSPAGGEDHGVTAGERLPEAGRVLVLDVEQPHLGAEAFELLAVPVLADKPHWLVAGSHEDGMEL